MLPGAGGAEGKSNCFLCLEFSYGDGNFREIPGGITHFEMVNFVLDEFRLHIASYLFLVVY